MLKAFQVSHLPVKWTIVSSLGASFDYRPRDILHL